MTNFNRLICDHLNATGFIPPGEHEPDAKWFVGFMTGEITYDVPVMLVPPSWAERFIRSLEYHGDAPQPYPNSTAINEGK